MIDTTQLLINIQLYIMLPLWGIAGFVDWCCHRATRIETTSGHGICSSSMMALKTAWLNLKAGEHCNALVIASELASRLFKASRYEAVQQQQAIDFNTEFLRWMLSDGAGALLLENRPRGRCFRIDWIKGFSHADSYPTCMSVGSLLSDSWDGFPCYRSWSGACSLKKITALCY